MHLSTVALGDTRSFTPSFLDYIQKKESLTRFYHRFPLVENFKDQIDEKSTSFPQTNRDVLVSVLNGQYKNLIMTDVVKRNISRLSDKNTFTVTTGHQLNIFTGPLYFIYKIVTVINACKKLKSIYPGKHFIPVYWMASEDHDFAEISYFRLSGKKYTWATDQLGAVGRFNPKSLESLLNEIPGETSPFKQAYTKHDTLSDAVRYYVNELFGEEGVVVVDADHRELKKELRHVMTEDIFKNTSKKLVEEKNAELTTLGYHPQVFARDINFFYLDHQLRSRLEKEGERFQVVDTDISFSLDEIAKIIESEPEKLSPNVILRPLYQEIILPNLAYVGGPSEVTYWLQLKGVFDHFHIPFPILMPRNFALVIDAPLQRKFAKTGLEINDLFEEKNSLFKSWVLKNTHHNLALSEEMKNASRLFDEIRQRAIKIDSTLGPLVGAEEKRTSKSLEKIEHKLLKAEKRNHADKLRQIEVVKDALFPGGGLQERTDNFLNFYQQDPQFIQKLIRHFDPFNFSFHVLTY